ncbi:DUF4276 family protein [Candidatus Viridilinea mediisalina]|uniref:DUF4276 domain-containing protein n=1 Tax=Candidatus Viridilinea mediisalina TaxID=2024553 RepID=A0A2A6RFW4_9CHLR|nr:DUF4276 family protein [Candidatus Viridilinea mediisalina]PDW01776.1 hypothetical protein CJ255_17395 [Candidatus Viridilinea mediisalina]
MRSLRIAFVAEGARDLQVIPVLIERLIAVAQPAPALRLSIDRQRWNTRRPFNAALVEVVTQAAFQSDLLVCHVDADAGDDQRVRQYKIDPGITQVTTACPQTLPIVWAVPVHAIEAWLLTDPEHFAEAIGATRRHVPMFPRHPDRIHRHEAKALFDRTIVDLLAKTQRQRRRLRPDLFAELVARESALPQLRRLPAFQSFEGDLMRTLVALGCHFTNLSEEVA